MSTSYQIDFGPQVTVRDTVKLYSSKNQHHSLLRLNRSWFITMRNTHLREALSRNSEVMNRDSLQQTIM